MNTVKLTILASVNQAEKEALSAYLEGVAPLYKKVNANPVIKSKFSESFIGNEEASLVSVMEFPTRAAVDEVFNSNAYKALLPLREKAFTRLEAYIGK